MWSPGVSAIITKLICDRNIRNLGWGWGKWRYHFLSYLLPIPCCLVVYGLVWLFGYGGLSIDKFTLIMNRGLFGSDNVLSFPIILLIISIIGFVRSMISALGEEIGWRGFLVPELVKITSFSKTSWIVGFIWAFWHVPGILFVGYNAGTSPYFAIPCFTLMIISMTFIMNWIRLRSGSLWTAAILHASHNLFIQSIFDLMTIDKGITRYLTTEFGIGMAVIYTILAYFFWKKRSELALAGNST
jgi:membrane protease YdiL (CAAX protease family)